MTVAGTCVQYLAKSSHLPILILKDDRHRDRYPDKSYRWGVCIDGSAISIKAFTTALEIKQKQDKIVVITVAESLVDKETVHHQIDEIAS